MRCHFVPQSYLRRLLNSENKLECFDFHREFDPTKAKAAKSTSQIEDWYVLKDIDQVPGLELVDEKQIENEFQRLFENDLTGALDRLEAGVLRVEDKKKLAAFVAFQLHRVPISRGYYRDVQRRRGQPLTREEQAQVNAHVVHGFLGTAISAFGLEPFLLKSVWMLVRADAAVPFITSDNPIGVGKHPSNMSFVDELTRRGVSGPELEARRSAYVVTVSPRHVLYVNTSIPAGSADTLVLRGKWDERRVREYNDSVFRSCLSCAYTVTREMAEEYSRRVRAGDITNDLFVDDPWGEAMRL